MKGILRAILNRRDDTDAAGMPIPKEKLAAFRPNDHFIASYPRSGNTWTRYLVRDIIAGGQPEVPITNSKPDLLIPGVHSKPLDPPERDAFKLPHRIFKSHNVRDLAGYRMVYLFRNPADSLVSYYHYHLRDDKMRALVPYGPDEFCRRYVAGWCEHVSVVLGYKLQCATDVHFVRYEDLLSDGLATLRGIVDYLDLPASDELLRETLEKNSFANHRAAEKDQSKNGEFFFRKGYAGAGEEEIRPETREFIDQKTRRIFAEAIDQVDGGKAKRTTPISAHVNLACAGIASLLTSLPLASLDF